jgi:hypothetical protein
LAHKDRKGRTVEGADMFGPTLSVAAYFGDRDRSFRLKVTGHFGAT